MTHKPSRVAGRRSGFVGPLALAAACSLTISRALAAVDFNPFATLDVAHNSNVFARPADDPPFADTGNRRLGDTIAQYLAGATADFAWQAQKLSLTAQGSRFQFDRFDQLNHYESKWGGNFDWRAATMVDGNLSYSQNRAMGPLADTLSEQLEIQTERLGSGTVRVLITPRWRFDLKSLWHELESPLPSYPEFGFKEARASGTLNYVGIDKLTAGLRGEYLDGAFHHIVGATSYRQSTAELVASYAVTDFSSFDAEAGYTRRRSTLVNPDDALLPGLSAAGLAGTDTTFTGSLGFRRQLSVKTNVGLRVFREIDSYVAGANSEVGTGGEANVKWEPDVKLALTARYRFTRQQIQGAVAISDFAARSDTARHAEIGLEYHARRWLTFRPYALYDERTSNFHDANFSATVVGIDFTAQLHSL